MNLRLMVENFMKARNPIMKLSARLIYLTVWRIDLHPMSRLSASGFSAGCSPLRLCTYSPVHSIRYRVQRSSFRPRCYGDEEKD